jgi:uracil-DNA glycosylase
MTHKTKVEELHELYNKYPTCASIPIDTQGATKIVYGEGDPNAKIMVVGEAPGQKEDELGRPFVGRSGELLTRTLHSLGAERKDVFITNVVKCRPPNNRTPTPQEVDLYKKYFLIPEIRIIKPKVILAVGSVAFKALLEDITSPISKARGLLYKKSGIIIIPTYHPAYILRNPAEFDNFKNDLALGVTMAKKHEI